MRSLSVKQCARAQPRAAREGGGEFAISSGAWRPRRSAVEEEEEGRSCWMVFLLDDSLRCHSALIHSFARTCIRTHKGIRQTRGHVGEEGARGLTAVVGEGGQGEEGEGGVGRGGASNQSASGPLILHWRAGGTTAPGHSGTATRSTDRQRGKETG